MKTALPLVLLVSLTAACGGGGGGGSDTPPVTDPSTPAPIVDRGTDIRNALVVETDGFRYELTNGTAGFVAGETRYKINVAAAPSKGGFGEALGYSGDAVTIYGGTDTGTQPNFAAAGGATANAPAGNATFSGHYSIADSLSKLAAADEHGNISLNYNAGSKTITGTSGNGVLAVNGSVGTGGAITGSVTVNGGAASIVDSSNFYGTGAAEVGIGFSNANFGGYVYGSQ